MLSKQRGDSDPVVVASGSGKVISDSGLAKLTVEEKDIVYIEFINTYEPTKKVSICKTDTDGNVIKTGAGFELYKASDFDDATEKPKPEAEAIVSGTTGENGILYLGELMLGEYRLIETKAPTGYVRLDSPIKITVAKGGVTATQGSRPSVIVVQGNTDWVEGQAEDTIQICVWNNPGAKLPATGGPGTILYTASGISLMALATILLLRKKAKDGL